MTELELEALIHRIVAELDARFRERGYNTKQAWGVAAPMLMASVNAILVAQTEAQGASKH